MNNVIPAIDAYTLLSGLDTGVYDSPKQSPISLTSPGYNKRCRHISKDEESPTFDRRKERKKERKNKRNGRKQRRNRS